MKIKIRIFLVSLNYFFNYLLLVYLFLIMIFFCNGNGLFFIVVYLVVRFLIWSEVFSV